MKNYFLLVSLIIAAAGLAACTINVGNTATTANGSNAANSAPAGSVGNTQTGSATKPAQPVNTDSSGKASEGSVVRVAFAAGESSASLTRDVSPNGSIDFLINAKNGQPMGLQIGYEGKASDIEAFLSEPGLQDVSLSFGPETRKEFSVKKNGDHRLTVNNMTGKKITFTLYVDIE